MINKNVAMLVLNCLRVNDCKDLGSEDLSFLCKILNILDENGIYRYTDGVIARFEKGTNVLHTLPLFCANKSDLMQVCDILRYFEKRGAEDYEKVKEK